MESLMRRIMACDTVVRPDKGGARSILLRLTVANSCVLIHSRADLGGVSP
jgi:hypothetical protein